MEYLLGGNIENPKQIIEKALAFFEKRFSQQMQFEGMIINNYFMGIIKEKSKHKNVNIWFFEDHKIFKSLFYNDIPDDIKGKKIDFNYDKQISNLKNDFIFAVFDEQKGIKVYKDIFAREKVYFTKIHPFLFSTSLKLLISLLDRKTFNYKSLGRYLATGLNNGYETIFQEINRLELGENLYINSNLYKIFKTWTPNKDFFERSKHDVMDTEYWVEYIYDILKETLNIPTKDPVFSMMSGGLDSTVLTSIFKKEYDIPIEAITIFVPSYNEEEVQKAKEIAEFINIPHYVKKIKINDYENLTETHAKVFNILEEPMGGTAYFSRYFGYNEIHKLNKKNSMIGEGAGETMSYLRDHVLNAFKKINYLYYVPRKLRTYSTRLFHYLYYPSFKITNLLSDKNTINSIDVILNSNFLESNSEIQTFVTSVQFCHMEDVYKLTRRRLNLDTYSEVNVNIYNSYPYNDFNKFGYQLLYLSPNGDPLISNVLSSYYDLKLYIPYDSDLSFKKLIPLPPYIKLTGDGYRTRYKWIVREIAMKKKLLPEKYFEWKTKYGLRQEFFNPDSFKSVQSYAIDLTRSLNPEFYLNLKRFENFFKKSSIKRLKKHSSEYLKFNIWLGFLGWLSTI